MLYAGAERPEMNVQPARHNSGSYQSRMQLTAPRSGSEGIDVSILVASGLSLLVTECRRKPHVPGVLVASASRAVGMLSVPRSPQDGEGILRSDGIDVTLPRDGRGLILLQAGPFPHFAGFFGQSLPSEMHDEQP